MNKVWRETDILLKWDTRNAEFKGLKDILKTPEEKEAHDRKLNCYIVIVASIWPAKDWDFLQRIQVMGRCDKTAPSKIYSDPSEVGEAAALGEENLLSALHFDASSKPLQI